MLCKVIHYAVGHLYAHTDNDAGATNVVQRTDGTVILLGSGRAERYVP